MSNMHDGTPPAASPRVNTALIAASVCTALLDEAAPRPWTLCQDMVILDSRRDHVLGVPLGDDRLVRRFNDNDWTNLAVDEFLNLMDIALHRTGHSLVTLDGSQMEVRWEMLCPGASDTFEIISGGQLVATGLNQVDAEFLIAMAGYAFRRSQRYL
jgi:hypothetical protein